MKRAMLLIGASLLLSLAGAVAGEQAMPIEQRVQQALDRLALTDQQVDRVTPIFRAGLQQQKTILESYGVDLEDVEGGEPPRLGFVKARRMSKELESVRERMLTDLDPMLSTDQMDELVRMQNERREAIRSRIRSRR